MNQSALMLAVHNLALELKCDLASLATEIWQLAYDEVIDLSEAEINKAVDDLETKHRPFDGSGAIVIEKLGIDN